VTLNQPPEGMSTSAGAADTHATSAAPPAADVDTAAQEPKLKKSRTNTPWTPAEELRLKHMRDAGNSWSDIAKVQTYQIDMGGKQTLINRATTDISAAH